MTSAMYFDRVAMNITIENYRGIISAAFPLDGIVLVAAPNASGKSAVAQATGAVLSQTPIPIPGIPKTLAGMLVNSSATKGKGFAQLDCDDASAIVEWPKSAIKTKGGALPFVSPIAAGIEPLTPPITAADTAQLMKRRGELLIELLAAKPTFEDLCARFERDGIPRNVAEAIWTDIERQGWEAAHARAKETGSRLKGQWEAVTGENYGSKKANNFVPTEWEPELEGESTESLQAQLTSARDALDGLIAINAVDDAERDRLQGLADQLDARKEAADEAAKLMKTLVDQNAAATAAKAKLRDPNAINVHRCPNCEAPLEYVGGKIVNTAEVSADEVAAWNAANADIARIQEEGTKQRANVNTANALVKEAQEAANAIAAMKEGNASAEEVERGRQAVALAASRLDAFTKKTKADRLQASILQNVDIVAALDSTGVRQDKLNAALKTFVDNFANKYAEVAGWNPIEIGTDMSLAYGGRAWAILSESERFRVRVLLQLAAAHFDCSRAVIIDAADILDKSGRNGLIKVLKTNAINAVVCMTFPERPLVPDLKKIGIGVSYWIEGGSLSEL